MGISSGLRQLLKKLYKNICQLWSFLLSTPKIGTATVMIPLPEEVSEDEKLARVICASSQPKKYKHKFYFDEIEGKYVVQVGTFLDNRNPMQLSVNRISTISIDKAHDLGIQHRNEHQKELTYHGFAEILAKMCFDLDCKVLKDDYGGTRPYHANIIYPVAQKEDSQQIAVQLAHYAEFRKYPPQQ